MKALKLNPTNNQKKVMMVALWKDMVVTPRFRMQISKRSKKITTTTKTIQPKRSLGSRMDVRFGSFTTDLSSCARFQSRSSLSGMLSSSSSPSPSFPSALGLTGSSLTSFSASLGFRFAGSSVVAFSSTSFGATVVPASAATVVSGLPVVVGSPVSRWADAERPSTSNVSARCATGWNKPSAWRCGNDAVRNSTSTPGRPRLPRPVTSRLSSPLPRAPQIPFRAQAFENRTGKTLMWGGCACTAEPRGRGALGPVQRGRLNWRQQRQHGGGD
mmetsp:Transcript_13942/g.30838  ORF Transcript_13942/g.30838 Transcript_13942/m.30838 type:complete len:272 (-) Transcript_13942:25-840(-)